MPHPRRPAPTSSTAASHLQSAISSLLAYSVVEPDPADKARALTIIGQLRALVAKDRQDLAQGALRNFGP